MILLLLFSFVSLIKCLSIQQYDKINTCCIDNDVCCIEDIVYYLDNFEYSAYEFEIAFNEIGCSGIKNKKIINTCCIEDIIYRLGKSFNYDALDASIKAYGPNINKDIVQNLFVEDINIINYIKYYGKTNNYPKFIYRSDCPQRFINILPIINYILNNRNYTTLARIVANDKVNIIKLLIINELIDPIHALIYAITNNNFNMVRGILGVNKPIKFNFMISLASAIGNIDIIELLLKDDRFRSEHSILTAAYYGRIDSIKILINDKLEEMCLWACSVWNTCPIAMALENKHFDIVDYILSSYTYEEEKAKRTGTNNYDIHIISVDKLKFTTTALNNGYSNIFTIGKIFYSLPRDIECIIDDHDDDICHYYINNLIQTGYDNKINILYKQSIQTDNIDIMKGLIDNLWGCRHEDLQRMLSMFEPNKWTAMELLAKKCNDFNTFK